MTSLHLIRAHLLTCLCTCVFSTPALASEPTSSSDEKAHPIPEGMRLGMHVLYGNTTHDAHHLPVWGAGIMGEHGLFHHRLELEWAGHMTHYELETEFTETLSLRLPWHMTTHTELFIGVGGMLRQHTRGNLLSAGLLASTGGLYWLDDELHWGLVLELDMVEDLTRATHEVEGLAGVVYRFGDDVHIR